MSFWFREQDVERFGGIDVLRDAGLGNLRILPVEHRELIESPEGGHFRVLSGSSSYTSSRILTLDRLADLLYPDAAMPHGVLAAMPNRHEVGVHLIRDDAVVPSLVNLATFAWKGTVSSPGPLPPNVYWVNRDRFQEVAVCDGKGVEFRFSPEFKAVMEELMPSADPAHRSKPPAM